MRSGTTQPPPSSRRSAAARAGTVPGRLPERRVVVIDDSPDPTPAALTAAELRTAPVPRPRVDRCDAARRRHGAEAALATVPQGG